MVKKLVLDTQKNIELCPVSLADRQQPSKLCKIGSTPIPGTGRLVWGIIAKSVEMHQSAEVPTPHASIIMVSTII